MIERSKLDEWRTMWPLPLTALLGIAGSGLGAYSTGVFMEQLTRTFGWSKSQFTSAMTIQVAVLLIVVPMVGRAVDRFGPRRVAMTGLAPAVLGFAGLGLADGQLWQWWLLNLLHTLGAVLIVPPVWVTAVAGRFQASRGLALAVALAGIGVGTALWPMLAAYYIDMFGWRLAYGALALTWGLVVTPLLLFCFFDGRDRPGAATDAKGAGAAPQVAPALKPLLLSRNFILLASAAGLFVVANYAMLIHLVPILRAHGISMAAAAALAGLSGMCSIVGRIGTGILLDTMPSKLFGALIFLLPAVVSALLGLGGDTFPLLVAAAALLGLAMGAESDIVAYMTARRFDHAVFGSIFSAIQTVTAVTALGGTMLAGFLFDFWGSYALFLAFAVPVAVLGALCLLLLPAEPGSGAASQTKARRDRLSPTAAA